MENSLGSCSLKSMSDLHKKAGVGGTSAQSQEQKAQSLQEFSHMILNVGNNTRDQITRTAKPDSLGSNPDSNKYLLAR